MFAIFYLAQPMSQMLGAPLSGWLINIGDQIPGVHGWQVMFAVEGLLAVLAGIAAFVFLINGPEHAKFLSDAEKKALKDMMAQEDTVKEETGPSGVWNAMKNGKVWYSTTIYFFITLAVPMATTISERLHDWLTRMWNGETSLITDDAWLPNPTGDRERAMGKGEPRVRGWGHLSSTG